MALEQRFIVRSLLKRLTREERSEVVLEAIRSLNHDDAPAGASLAVSLLAEHPHDSGRAELLNHLRWCLVQGHTARVDLVCSQDPDLRRDLLRDVTRALHDTACRLGGRLRGKDSVALVVDKTVDVPEVVEIHHPEVVSWRRDLEADVTAVPSLLKFARCAKSTHSSQETLDTLFCSTLIFLGTSDKKICSEARGLLVTVFSDGCCNSSSDRMLVWTCVQKLITTTADSFYQSLGYGIWLVWAAADSNLIGSWLGPQYWDLIRLGLRHGDGERRKQCLGIARLSVAIAAEDKSTRSMVYSGNDLCIDALALEEQYERFFTVFETIVLGRYLNQIVECEADLNALASPNSLVRPEWLYTLLATAIGPNIQESNRKFIGGWIMRSHFQRDKSDQFVDFFNDAFLPWVTLGSLFTSTIRKSNGEMRCHHGDRLAKYVSHLLQSNTTSKATGTQLVDAVLDSLTGRRSGSFAYAAVYLLDGLARAFENPGQLTFSSAQIEKVLGLSTWSDLPEVARDFVLVRCLKLCAEFPAHSNGADQSPSLRSAVAQWQELQMACRQPDRAVNSKLGEPIASWNSHLSQRDIQERHTMDKCRNLCASLDLVQHGENLSTQLSESLQDIWNDIEHLEYPKRLLINMPKLLLNDIVVGQAALSDSLASTISTILHEIQDLSGNRLYMFSPILCAIRHIVLTLPDAATFLSLWDVVLHFARSLPDPSVDLRLEDTTIGLLKDVSPEFSRFGYEHYFGERETLGYAALLDLVSRMGDTHHSSAKYILDRLLQRWMIQRTPPPTVSPWKSAVQLQIMLLCCEHVVKAADANEVARLLTDLYYVLSIEPLPKYRYLLSWIIARTYLKHGDLTNEILESLKTKDHHSNPKYVASLMKIAVMIARLDSADPLFAQQLSAAFVPLAASSKVVIRHEAQWQVPILMDHARGRNWAAICENSSFVALDDYIRSLERFSDPPLERQLDRFNPVNDHTMTNLVEGRWFGLDSVESPFCGRKDFLELYQTDIETRGEDGVYSASCIPLGDSIIRFETPPNTAMDDIDELPSPAHVKLVPSTANGSRALQTKGTAYLQNSAERAQKRSENLIVVASLVDNPHNLGGLSRVSEVFGAAELHLQNQNVTSTKDFVSVAVSSHLHFPILQLSAGSLPAYLVEKKKEGWSTVGIEQTDRSLILGSPQCALPEKVVLVVGSEKEGIPAVVLGECDMLVEIPQHGVTRSLNVQTAAGIVLFEYARQHRGA